LSYHTTDGLRETKREVRLEALTWFHADIVRVMTLLGAERVRDLNRSLIELPPDRKI